MFLTTTMLCAINILRVNTSPISYNQVYYSRDLNSMVILTVATLDNGFGDSGFVASYYDGITRERTDLFSVFLYSSTEPDMTDVRVTVFEPINYVGSMFVTTDGVTSYNGPYADFGKIELYKTGVYTLTIPEEGDDEYNDNYFGFYLTYLDEVEFDKISQGESDYQRGYDTGYTSGYDDGYLTGSTDGYNQGRHDYENTSANINSIFNGILSIGLVPIEFFMSIFNFEIFGINITSLISAILSMAVLVILLRYVLRG